MDNVTSIITRRTEDADSVWPEFAWTLAGAYLAVIFICSVIGNSIVLFLFVWDRSLRTPTNMFLLSLTVTDWLVTIAGIPFVTASIFAHEWLFGYSSCMAYAFVMTFLGLNSLLSHAAIAVDRYLVITNPHFGMIVTYPKAFGMIAATWVVALTWAILPLVGWGQFTTEGTGAWCSMMWNSDRLDIKAYVLTMFFSTFVASLGIMAFCYCRIFLTMRRMPRWASSTNLKMQEKNRRKRELKLLRTLIAIAVAFLLAWTPYAVTALIAIFGPHDFLSVTAMTLPSLFAKGSVVINPFIYAVTSQVFRTSLRKATNSITSTLCPRHFKRSLTPTTSTVKTLASKSSQQSDAIEEVKKQLSKKKKKEKLIKNEMSSSLLIPGAREICATPNPAPPSTRDLSVRGSERAAPQSPAGLEMKTSVAIEMERLEKLMPRKSKKYRNNRRQSTDPILPEGGSLRLKPVVDDEIVHHEDHHAEESANVEKRDTDGDHAESRSRAESNPYLSSHTAFVRELKEKFLQLVGTDSDKENDSRSENFESKSKGKRVVLKSSDDDNLNIDPNRISKDGTDEMEPSGELSPRSSYNNDSGVFDSGPAYATTKST